MARPARRVKRPARSSHRAKVDSPTVHALKVRVQTHHAALNSIVLMMVVMKAPISSSAPRCAGVLMENAVMNAPVLT